MTKFKNNEEKWTVYRLTNSINGKIYLGQTSRPLNKRMGKNGCNYKNSIYLYNAIQKDGVENFKYDTFVICDNKETADFLETYYIYQFESQNPKIGYNIKDGGSAGKHLETTKNKISETLKKQAASWSPEELARRSAPIAGWWKDKERGPHTEEWKEENSNMMKKWHSNNEHPMQGKHHTDESKDKISESSKGKKRSPEAVAKGAAKRRRDINVFKELGIIIAYISENTIVSIKEKFGVNERRIYATFDKYGVPRLENHKNWTDQKHTETTKKKMSEARKEYWNNKNKK